jgi:predicted GIY-YIG superfamily endonuclease
MRGFVYIIENEKGIRYVGSTTDISRRMGEHNRISHNSKFTRQSECWTLRYCEEFETIQQARIYERKVKKSSFERSKLYKKITEHSSVG